MCQLNNRARGVGNWVKAATAPCMSITNIILAPKWQVGLLGLTARGLTPGLCGVRVSLESKHWLNCVLALHRVSNSNYDRRRVRCAVR